MFTKPSRPIDTVWIHCSAASRSSITANEVRSWHKQRGWSDIGYHYFIQTDGTLEEGRPLEKIGAHVKGYNKRSIGICLNGLHPSDFTEAQFDTLRKLCGEIDDAYGGMRFRGHNEVAAKACPVFDYRKVLNLDRKGYIKEVEPKGTKVDKPAIDLKQAAAVCTPVIAGAGTAVSGLNPIVQGILAVPIALALVVAIGYVGLRLWKKYK